MTTTESNLSVDPQLLNDELLWANGAEARADVFTTLRDEAPVVFLAEPEIPDMPTGPGYWLLTRYADVMHVSRHPDLFCSGNGTNIPDLPVEIAEFIGSMINMDDPRHTRLRRIVNRAFTPRRVAAIDLDVQVKAREIVRRASPNGQLRLRRTRSPPSCRCRSSAT